MNITINIDEYKLKRIKDRIEYWDMILNHPEYQTTQEEREKAFQQWRSAHFILKNLGIDL